QGAISAFRGGENVYLAPNGPQGFNSHIADLYQQQIDQAGGDLYIAILPFDASGSAEQAIGEIRDGVGEPGTYAVFMDNQFRVAGSGPAEQAATAAAQANPQDPGLAIKDWLQRMATVDGS